MNDPASVWSNADELERRLAGVAEAPCNLFTALLPGDEGRVAPVFPAELRPAAVLVGLVERQGGPRLLLTTRAAHLRHHAGQISFPGGRMESFDQSIAAAALREAFEEVGLPAQNVRILGQMRPYDTVTGFRIHPIVGWITPPAAWILDPIEVQDVFEMPLSFVLDLANHRREQRMRDGRMREYWTLPWNGRNVWGATAGIIVNLVRLLQRQP